ncbi:MAG: hypothetical protein WC806_02525 [Candidatus Gracilibacteria bacterium]
MAHRAFKAEAQRRIPKGLAVLRVRRQRRMDQLMDQDAEHIEGIGKVGPDDQLAMAVVGGLGRPDLAGDLAFLPRRGEGDREADRFGNDKAKLEKMWA